MVLIWIALTFADADLEPLVELCGLCPACFLPRVLPAARASCSYHVSPLSHKSRACDCGRRDLVRLELLPIDPHVQLSIGTFQLDISCINSTLGPRGPLGQGQRQAGESCQKRFGPAADTGRGSLVIHAILLLRSGF